MAIVDKIQGAMTQTVVYWGTPVPDGNGTYTYNDPTEILCRWEEKTEVISRVGAQGKKGEELVSFAQIFTKQDVDESGYLYLGDLDDLDSAEEAMPETVSGAYRIQQFKKLPEFGSTNKFLRKAYL